MFRKQNTQRLKKKGNFILFDSFRQLCKNTPLKQMLQFPPSHHHAEVIIILFMSIAHTLMKHHKTASSFQPQDKLDLLNAAAVLSPLYVWRSVTSQWPSGFCTQWRFYTHIIKTVNMDTLNIDHHMAKRAFFPSDKPVC